MVVSFHKASQMVVNEPENWALWYHLVLNISDYHGTIMEGDHYGRGPLWKRTIREGDHYRNKVTRSFNAIPATMIRGVF